MRSEEEIKQAIVELEQEKQKHRDVLDNIKNSEGI